MQLPPTRLCALPLRFWISLALAIYIFSPSAALVPARLLLLLFQRDVAGGVTAPAALLLRPLTYLLPPAMWLAFFFQPACAPSLGEPMSASAGSDTR